MGQLTAVIDIFCPDCSNLMFIDFSYFGDIVRCFACGSVFRIPYPPFPDCIIPDIFDVPKPPHLDPLPPPDEINEMESLFRSGKHIPYIQKWFDYSCIITPCIPFSLLLYYFCPYCHRPILAPLGGLGCYLYCSNCTRSFYVSLDITALTIPDMERLLSHFEAKHKRRRTLPPPEWSDRLSDFWEAYGRTIMRTAVQISWRMLLPR